MPTQVHGIHTRSDVAVSLARESISVLLYKTRLYQRVNELMSCRLIKEEGTYLLCEIALAAPATFLAQLS